MKKTIIAATLAAGLSTPALAGGYEPVMTEEVIVTETTQASSSSAMTVVLVAALIAFATAAVSGGN